MDFSSQISRPGVDMSYLQLLTSRAVWRIAFLEKYVSWFAPSQRRCLNTNYQKKQYCTVGIQV
jgi:hypothetical protein